MIDWLGRRYLALVALVLGNRISSAVLITRIATKANCRGRRDYFNGLARAEVNVLNASADLWEAYMRYRVQISFDYDRFCVTTREFCSRRRAELWARKIMLLSNADACRVLAPGGEAVTLFVRDDEGVLSEVPTTRRHTSC